MLVFHEFEFYVTFYLARLTFSSPTLMMIHYTPGRECMGFQDLHLYHADGDRLGDASYTTSITSSARNYQ
jgi:hypothetical protein